MAKSNAERQRAWRDRQRGGPPKPRRRVAVCGTPSGYNRHKRLGETPCIPCRDAKRAAARKKKETP